MFDLRLKIPPLLVFIFSLMLMKGIAELFPKSTVIAAIPPLFFYLFIGISALIGGLGLQAFLANKTTVNPTLTTASTTLVTKGVYRVTRNPMYLCLLLLLMAAALYLLSGYSVVGCVFFVCYINRFQIIPEEEYLLRQFADEYRQYKNKVRRWL